MKLPRKTRRQIASPHHASGSRSVRRALDMLELLLKHGEPLTVAEIVQSLRIPKSTAYELVRVLTEADVLAPAGRSSGLYLGRKLYELGMAYRSNVDLLRDGQLIAEELRDETGETVQLSVLDRGHMMVLLKQEGIGHLRIISNVGSRVPVNWAAAGRLLVSDFDHEALQALLKATVRPSPTGKAATEIPKLIEQIRKFRRQGYGTELNEANEHAGCVAAPVIDSTRRCIAALSIVVPEQRLTRPHREELITSVVRAAARLSRQIG